MPFIQRSYEVQVESISARVSSFIELALGVCHVLSVIAFMVYFWPCLHLGFHLAACLLDHPKALIKTITDFLECYNSC